MSTRYLSNATLALAGGFLIVASRAFTQPNIEWLAFAMGIVAVALSAGIALKDRGTVQRGLDVLTAGIGAWTIIETLVFSGATNTHLAFASGLALAALALAGLTNHELSTERVVHSLEISHQETAESEFAHTA
jgi:hypothetical protein